MEKTILIIKNISHEGPGIFLNILNKRNIKFRIIDLSQNEKIPPIEKFNGIVILGGPDSANDMSDNIINEISVIRHIVSKKIPFLGICLGLQLLVKAMEGDVIKCQNKEVGFIDPLGNNYTVELTQKGKNDPLFNGLSHKFNVFQLHSETVKLTNEFDLLATGKFCKNQIVKIGENAYGIQSHFELTQEMLENWLEIDTDLIVLNKYEMMKYFKSIQNDYLQTGKKLFNNFLNIAGF